MPAGVRITYLLLLGGLAVAGFFLTDVPWWIKALMGAAVMVPIVVAEIVASKRPAR